MKKISLLLLISIFISSCALKHSKLEPKAPENTECNGHLDNLIASLDKTSDKKNYENGIEFIFPKDKNLQAKIINKFDPFKLTSLKKDLRFLTAIHNDDTKFIKENLLSCDPLKLLKFYTTSIYFLNNQSSDKNLRKALLEKLIKGLKSRTNASRSFIENIMAIHILKFGTDNNLFLSQKEQILDTHRRISEDSDGHAFPGLEDEIFISQMYALEIHDILMRL